MRAGITADFAKRRVLPYRNPGGPLSIGECADSFVNIRNPLPLMPSFNQTFQERAERSAKAKQVALEKLRNKAPVDEAVLAERRAAAERKEAAQAAKRAEKQAERDRIAAEKLAAEEAAVAAAEAERIAAAEAAEKARPKLPTAAELKEARDARYAARKQRAGKK